MSRLVWGLGVGGLAAAILASSWLSRPVAVPREEVPPPPSVERPSGSSAGPSSGPREEATVPPHHPDAVTSSAPVPFPGGTGRSGRRWTALSRSVSRLPEQRQRIVSALRGHYDTPLQRRDAVLAAFESSGESQAAWTEQARAALGTWRATLENEVLPLRAEPPRCYAAGCVTRVTFPDALSYEDARRRVPELELTGVGAHLQLPPEHLPSGEVTVSWAVLPPERG